MSDRYCPRCHTMLSHRELNECLICEAKSELAQASCYAAALETVRCDDCQCLLSQQERADARDTGFPECSDCAIKRHNAPESSRTEPKIP